MAFLAFAERAVAATTAQTEAATAQSGLAALGVDPVLLFVQTVNFFLILIILTWILYRPLLRLLNQRRAMIAEGLAAAEEQQRQAALAETERAELLRQTRQEAAALLTETHQEIKAERAATKAALAKEREQLLATIAQRLGEGQTKMEANLKDKVAGLVIKALEKIVTAQPTRSAELKAAALKTFKELE